MNETIFRLIPDTLAETLGISNSVVTPIILLGVATFLSLAVLRFTGSYILSILAIGGVIIFGAFIGWLPLWVALLAGFLGTVTIIFTRFWEDSEGSSIAIKVESNSKDLVLRIEKSSEKLLQYINNLDALLDIRTVVKYGESGWGLFLGSDGTLQINDSYDWYITGKHPSQDLFKIVGLHKEDDAKNLVYLLGRDTNLDKPFLTPISLVYLEGDIAECILWVERKGYNPIPGVTTLVDCVAEGTCEDTTGVKSVISILPIISTAVILLGAITWLSKKG